MIDKVCKNCKSYGFAGVDKGCVCTDKDSKYHDNWVGAQYTCDKWVYILEEQGGNGKRAL